nr:hypothetical protein [Candidatus Njordarchaeum guaymaensis]
MAKDSEIPPEEEDMVIEEIARKIVEIGMEDIAPWLLGMSYPLVYIGGQMTRVFVGPYAVLLGKREGSFEKYVSILEKRENILKLIKRIDKLGDEKRAEERKRKRKSGNK